MGFDSLKTSQKKHKNQMKGKETKLPHLELVDKKKRVREMMNSARIHPKMGPARASIKGKKMAELDLGFESSWL